MVFLIVIVATAAAGDDTCGYDGKRWFFFYCGKNNIKDTILTIFSCIVQGLLSTFIFLYKSHQNPSPEILTFLN